MVIYNWEKIKHKRRPFDDGSMIAIKSNSSRGKYRCLSIHKDIIDKVNPKAKFVSVLYSKKGYIGLMFTSEPEKDSYILRKVSILRFEIRSVMFDSFENRKYFEKDVKIEDEMAIIKTGLKDKNVQPLTYDFKINEGNLKEKSI